MEYFSHFLGFLRKSLIYFPSKSKEGSFEEFISTTYSGPRRECTFRVSPQHTGWVVYICHILHHKPTYSLFITIRTLYKAYDTSKTHKHTLVILITFTLYDIIIYAILHTTLVLIFMLVVPADHLQNRFWHVHFIFQMHFGLSRWFYEAS